MDPFFGEKAEMIFAAAAVTFGLVGICALAGVFFKCRIDLQKLGSQAVFFQILGYSHVEWKVYLGELFD